MQKGSHTVWGRGGPGYRLRYLETIFHKAEASHVSRGPEFGACWKACFARYIRFRNSFAGYIRFRKRSFLL